MSNVVQVAGIDPAFAHTGIARMHLDIDTMDLQLDEIRLITTEPDGRKQVRQNSDDLRRAREIHERLHEATDDCHMLFAEIPQGSQNSRSATGFGIAIGVLASCKVPLIEVQPTETKMASVGTKTATKPEIIAWAAGLYQDAEWKRYEKDVFTKGELRHQAGDLHLDNEHAADACAIVHAGIRRREFVDLISMWKFRGLS